MHSIAHLANSSATSSLVPPVASLLATILTSRQQQQQQIQTPQAATKAQSHNLNLNSSYSSIRSIQPRHGRVSLILGDPATRAEFETTSGHVQSAIISGERRYGFPRESSALITQATIRKPIGQPVMLTKTLDGFYAFNNITLRTCRDVLKPIGVDRCVLADYVEDCANDEGSIDYVAFFFCAFSPSKMNIALSIAILWLLMLFVATAVTATDFLCPALFMISKTLGMSQNIAGVTFLAFGNMSADIFAAINGIRLGKPDLVISVICGSATVITTAIVGAVFAIREFRLDKVIFVRDILFLLAAVSLLAYIFAVPGRIRLRDSISLLSLYGLYVFVIMISRHFSKDKPLEGMHGHAKGDEPSTIEFEGVHIDDDPSATMVVMRRFLLLKDEPLPFSGGHSKSPSFTLNTSIHHHNHSHNRSEHQTSESNGQPEGAHNGTLEDHKNSLKVPSAPKSGRRVTLFEDNLFSGADSLSPDMAARRSRSASILSVSKHQLASLRRASRDIRRQSIDFLSAVSPIDPDVWRQRNWGGRTMELVKAPIRLFLLLTTPMADIDGKHEWNKPLSTLHCITGPIFVVYAFGFGNEWLGPLTIPVWVFIVAAPIAFTIIFTSSSETPPFYYNAYSSYLGFVVAITWIYTISSEVINLLRAVGIVLDLSNEIMGLTILAWGNSMLDTITNISIARKGLPKMALAACYGGPLMSTLLGIGLPSFVTLLIDPNHHTTLGSSPLIYIMFAFIIVGLLTTLLVTCLLKFQASRNLGLFLIGLYLFMAVCEWLTEFKVFSIDWIIKFVQTLV